MPRKVNLIPMAGEGKRFVDVGYEIPKPLIMVGGKPMIIRSASSLPTTDQWIFACRKEHISNFHIDKTLQEYYEKIEIISVSQLTEGQASTCLLAKDLLLQDDILTIGACDNAMMYDNEKYLSILSRSDCDVVLWTFRNNPTVLQNPGMYGWVVVNQNNQVNRVSVKVPISDNPIKDHAVIGAFTFKKAGDFIKFSEEMIKQNRRINNEFYIDELINVMIENGKQVLVFEVDKYICWGTPNDLVAYNYWRDYFLHELETKI